ncbi:MAG: hypothetical protein HY922_11165 [Elusimicrobia bacterium]|nr:hypothetical protein [Elusimicrobiota bacterium]
MNKFLLFMFGLALVVCALVGIFGMLAMMAANYGLGAFPLIIIPLSFARLALWSFRRMGGPNPLENRKLFKFMGVLAVIVVILTVHDIYKSATKRDPVRDDIPGVYVGNYVGGREVYDIRPDGTFSQTFTKDGNTVYFSTGIWKLDGWKVEFEPQIRFDYEHLSELSDKASSRYNNGGGYWSDDGIMFNDDLLIGVTKQKKTP